MNLHAALTDRVHTVGRACASKIDVQPVLFGGVIWKEGTVQNRVGMKKLISPGKRIADWLSIGASSLIYGIPSHLNQQDGICLNTLTIFLQKGSTGRLADKMRGLNTLTYSLQVPYRLIGCRSTHSASGPSRISQMMKSCAVTILVPPKPTPCQEEQKPNKDNDSDNDEQGQ